MRGYRAGVAKGTTKQARSADGTGATRGGERPATPPVAIFHGPDRFSQLDRTEQLRSALTARHGDIGGAYFDGASASPADILDECRSLSLMQQHKLVVVDNADLLVKGGDDDEGAPPPRPRGAHSARTARDLLEAYAQSPDPSATLVLRAANWRAPNLDKAVLHSGGIAVKCEEPRAHEAEAWVLQRAKSAHRSGIEPDAAHLLVETVGPDLGRLDMELAKLSLVDPGRPIVASIVKEMVGVTREEDFWAIQPTLLSGDAAAALRHLHEMLEVSRHDPTPLLFTFFDLARKLHGAAVGLRSREPVGALMGRLKLWGQAGNLVIDKARRVDPLAAAGLMAQIVDGMVRQRTGRGDAVHILEGLSLGFASVCGA